MSTDAFGTHSRAPLLSAQRIDQLIETHFPHVHGGEKSFFIEDVTSRTSRVRMRFDPRHVRPGGTISGPAMFTLGDIAIWVAVMGAMGEPGMDAVTSHFNLHFLSRPGQQDMVGHVQLLRVSKRSAIAECQLFSAGSDAMVAHGVAGYAIPSSSSGKVIPQVR